MRLIIDSGATKAEWCLTYGGKPEMRFKTDGMNFSTMTYDDISAIVVAAAAKCGDAPVSGVSLYAAGLIEGSPAYFAAKSAFETVFPVSEVECVSDMLAAARAVCGRSEGIAAILGTGSNSCFYDGAVITRNVRSGGFILGDEGGGACLGKMFLSDYIKGLVPEPLASEFGAAFDVDYMTIVQRVYRQGSPSAYLGSFAPWILEHSESSDYVKGLVMDNLSRFFDRSLMRYGRPDVAVGFVGGFAAACEDSLRLVAGYKGVRVSGIMASPMEGLIKFHAL